MRARIYSVLLCILLLIALCIPKGNDSGKGISDLFDDTTNLYIWYTDEALTDYINSSVVHYQEQCSDKIRVVPKLVSGLEYLEQINAASDSEECADVYILNNDSMEKAYLAGIATPLEKAGKLVTAEHFPESAINAVTYKDKIVACPLYYETSVLLCNETYLNDMAKEAIQAQADAKEGEAAMEALEGATDEELEAMAGAEEATEKVIAESEISEKKEDMIPSTIEDLLTFAENYDAPENVEAILKWDVNDIFFNYFFVGDSINVGGKCGDNESEIDIYNPQAVEALTVYQGLNQFFSIDATTSSYESALSDFIEGKTIFTIATTDAIAKIEEKKENGEFPYDYVVTTLPKINQNIDTRSMSVTYGACVNGYSAHKKQANDFISYMAKEINEDFYYKTGKIPADHTISYSDSNVAATMQEYEKSIPLPKMLETGNFWISLEIAFTNIWNGADVDGELQKLSEQMKAQTGVSE